MKLFKSAIVHLANGEEATIEDIMHGESKVRLRRANGQALDVPAQLIQRTRQGDLTLPGASLTDNTTTNDLGKNLGHDRLAGEELVIPVIEESASVGTRLVETGRVKIEKKVLEEKQVLQEPLSREHVRVERVEVNRYIDEPAASRYEGDELIVPVMEEVLVIEKKLLLREEIRVRTEREVVTEPVEVTVRKESVAISRSDNQPPNHSTDHTRNSN